MNQLEWIFGAKGTELCQRMFSLRERFVRLFPGDLFGEIGSFLSNCSESFLKTHTVSNLRRILFAQCRLHRAVKELSSQRIHSAILELSPSVYGVAIAFCDLSDEEILNERQICKGIQALIPAIKPIADSFFSKKQDKIHFFYLEIKKMRGGIFSKADKQMLASGLHPELLQRIQQGSRAFFLPGKEEELFKNIRHLSKEIKYVNDLPQVLISFVEGFQDTLKFLIIVLRVVKPGTLSILSQSAQLPSILQFSLENVLHIEKLRNKYPKEASVFTLEVNSSCFLRPDKAVNLRAARQYIVKALEGMLGPFRDYNGGLLSQENEQLIKIKEALNQQGLFFPFLDDLFYAIKPIQMRSLISVETAIELIFLYRKASAYSLEPDQVYSCEFSTVKEAQLAIVKTKEKSWKASLHQKILFQSPQIGCSCLDTDGYLYLFFFLQSTDFCLQEAMEKELSHCQNPLSETKRAIFRMNFQGGDPPSLNPRLAADIQCHILSNFLFEGLTRINRLGEIELGAAEKLEISPSKTRYTFYLRSSCWSNGEEVTAYHFERTLKKALMANPAGCMGHDFFGQIRNAKKARMGSVTLDQVGITAKNGKKLCIDLDSPCPYFLNLLATPSFFPLFGDAEEPQVFNGPFILAEWERDSKLVLSQNPFYWDARRVKLGGIQISMIRDPQEAYGLFQKGELDLIGDPITPLTPALLKSPEVQQRLQSKPISRVFWIHCNFHTYPLHNSYLRKALSLALNRKRLIETVFVKQIPHLSLLPPKYSSFHGALEGDREKARLYFEKGLEELGIQREAFPKLVMTHSNLSFEKTLMEELAFQWKETLGISIVSRQLPWSEFSSALEKGDFQLGGLFRRDIFNHPMSYLSFFKKSPNNFHSWENREYEKLLKLFSKEGKNLEKIEKLLTEKAPAIPLVNQNYLFLTNERIKNLHWNENGCIDLKDVRIDEINPNIFHFPVASDGMF